MMENWKSSFRANVIKGDKDDSRHESGHNIFWTHSIIKIKCYFVSGLNRLKGQDLLLGNTLQVFRLCENPSWGTESFLVVSSDSSELSDFAYMLRKRLMLILMPCSFDNISPCPAACLTLPQGMVTAVLPSLSVFPWVKITKWGCLEGSVC